MFIKKKKQEDVEANRKSAASMQGLTDDNIILSVFDRYQVVALQGTNTVTFLNMSKSGKLKPDAARNEGIKLQIPNRILRFRNDEYDRFGVLILTDEKVGLPPGSEYADVMGCRLFTYPFTPIVGSRVTLSTIKEGHVFNLLTSDQSKALAEDSYFRTMRANKAMFESKTDEFAVAEDNKPDKVKEAFTKDNLYVVVVTSDRNQKSMMYAIKAHK